MTLSDTPKAANATAGSIGTLGEEQQAGRRVLPSNGRLASGPARATQARVSNTASEHTQADHGTLTLEFGIKRSALAPELRELAIEVGLDAAAEQFIEAALARPHGRLQTWLHDLGCKIAPDFDVNGLLNMYRVHLLSAEQWDALLPEQARGGVHLDIGAGNGDLTQQLQARFDRTLVTEASWTMRRRLRRRGFATTPHDLRATKELERAAFVSCLNVLDRTAYPVTLLQRIAHAAPRVRWLVVAVPLPLDPFFYRGPFTLDPKERLRAPGPSWEQAVGQLHAALEGALPAFRLRRFTRAPYLSWGDAHNSLYALDDVVFAFERTGESAQES